MSRRRHRGVPVQDVHHCFEISSRNMCRLYNTAAMAAESATATAAVPAAVRGRGRLPAPPIQPAIQPAPAALAIQPAPPIQPAIHGRADPASVQPIPLAKTARTLTIPTIAKYTFKHLHTQAFHGKKILKSGCTIRCRSRVLRQQCV
jgi:hypothetical protein